MRSGIVMMLIAAPLVGCGSSGASPDDAGHEAGHGDAGRDAIADATKPDRSADTGSDVYEPTAAEKGEFAELVTFAKDELVNAGTPGVSIAVVLHGKLAFAEGVGKRNTSTGDPVTTKTLFRAGSMSKMIVAATAMTLVEEGKLDLAKPLTTYLPWFTMKGGPPPAGMTTAALLSHTSGFPADTISQCGTTTSGSRLDFFKNNPQPSWFPPGAAWVYSNTGFALAATVVEAAAGGAMPYEALSAARVLGPAEMSTATFDAAAAEKADHATGYDLSTTGAVVGVYEPTDFACPLINPPGGLNATATDYAHFAEVLLAHGGSVLEPSSVAAMETPHADMHTWASQEYGYALIVDKWPYLAHDTVWHDGEVPGYTSMMLTVPDLGFAVIALANSTDGPPKYDTVGDIANQAVLLFLPPPTNNGITLTTPSSDWTPYVGTYDDLWGFLGKGIVVSIDGPDGGTPTLLVNAPNALSFYGDGSPSPLQGTLQQAADDTWVLPGGIESVTFFPGGPGGTSQYFATRVGVGVR